MSGPETPAKMGIKIERPPTEKIGAFHFVLLIISFLLIGFVTWMLLLEWTGTPLPAFLRLAVTQ